MARVSRAVLLETAFELIERHGLDQLTVRKVAAAADVVPSAIYRHFSDKVDLMRALADEMLAGAGDPLEAADWIGLLVGYSTRMRAILLSRRDGGRLMSNGYSTHTNSALAYALLVDILRQGDVPEMWQGTIAFALRDYIVGHVIEEQSRLPATKSDGRGQVPDESAVDVFRTARAAMRIDPEMRFRKGLDLFILGIITGQLEGFLTEP